MHSGRAAGHIEEECIFQQDRAISVVWARESSRGRGPRGGAVAGFREPAQASSLRLPVPCICSPNPSRKFPSVTGAWLRGMQVWGAEPGGEGQIGLGYLAGQIEVSAFIILGFLSLSVKEE